MRLLQSLGVKYLLLLIPCGLLFAEEPIAVTDTSTLSAKIDQEVTVIGSPNAQSKTSTEGHFFYHFDETSFTVFCYEASAALFPEEKRPAGLVGKLIRIKGKVRMYKDKQQIAIRKAEQIEILPTEKAVEREVEKK